MTTGLVLQERLREGLLSMRSPIAAWPYRPGGAAAAEPTALAGLAFRANDVSSTEARAASDWLAAGQHPDGSVSISATLAHPGWATSYALLLWTALDAPQAVRSKAASWLLAQHGKTEAARSNLVTGHDATLDGWTWAPTTFPWLEPTALAVLALRRQGLGDHPRVRDGLRLIHDRAIPSGGWNYGNTTVFGHELRPQPGPTALALLALSGTVPRTPAINRGLACLESGLPEFRAGWSLGWGLLALRAWDRPQTVTESLVTKAAETALHRPNPTLALAALLLARSERGDALLGEGPGSSSV